MKKIIFFLFALMFFTFLSCDDCDSDPAHYSEVKIGEVSRNLFSQFNSKKLITFVNSKNEKIQYTITHEIVNSLDSFDGLSSKNRTICTYDAVKTEGHAFYLSANNVNKYAVTLGSNYKYNYTLNIPSKTYDNWFLEALPQDETFAWVEYYIDQTVSPAKYDTVTIQGNKYPKIKNSYGEKALFNDNKGLIAIKIPEKDDDWWLVDKVE